jgi:signal transduction histidine kinase
VALAVRCLVENALEAMPEGGTLGLRTREDAEGCVLEVADTGPGLAPDLARKAFEPFVTTKPGHAGLGLCIARRLAQKHGARVRSVGGGEARGTRMELRFPVKSA